MKRARQIHSYTKEYFYMHAYRVIDKFHAKIKL